MRIESVAGTAGRGDDFRVLRGALGDFAATVRAQSVVLEEVGRALSGVAVERSWLGKLPESGQLADSYGAHRDAEFAGLAELVTALADVAVALEATAAGYVTADSVVADAVGSVGATESRLAAVLR